MAEYLIQSESLTSVADEIRILSGTTGTMGLDAMKTNVATANTNVWEPGVYGWEEYLNA